MSDQGEGVTGPGVAAGMAGAAEVRPAASVVNRHGGGPFVLVCDHASNALPPAFGTLGLDPSDLSRHIAWDPGALGVAERLAALLDAPLVASRVSRLVVDCNRPLDAPDLIWEVSETTAIPGNAGLSAEQRAGRVALAWTPFHQAIEAVLDERKGRATAVVSIHSFTPVYRGVARPWQVGVLHDEDERLSAPLLAALARDGGLTVGDNQPYSPADRVYYTLERHARARGLPCAMIEIRNDEIADANGQQAWAERLAGHLGRLAATEAALAGLEPVAII